MSILVSHRELLFLFYNINYNLSQANDMNPEDMQTKSDRISLFLIMGRFPEERKALRHLFQKNLSFQSLCDDYRECLEELQTWTQSTSKEAPAICRAYEELLQELEQEIRQYLEHDEA